VLPRRGAPARRRTIIKGEKIAMAIQFRLNPVVLKSVPLFSAFTEQQLVTLLNYVQHRSFPRNVFVIQAGDETDSLYVILSGKVKVLIPDDQGHEVILSVMGPHDFFGEMGILDDQPRSASVSTLEPCEMLRLSKAGFMTCLKENSDVAMLVIRNLVKRLREADRKIESLALIDVSGRVVRLLVDMAEEVDGKLVVSRTPPKQEIARMIGASREMVSRVIKELQGKGLIRAERRSMVIVDRNISRRGH
jgi:CRP/FNR family transcriptional regulator, cyclic AMP receptor protein